MAIIPDDFKSINAFRRRIRSFEFDEDRRRFLREVKTVMKIDLALADTTVWKLDPEGAVVQESVPAFFDSDGQPKSWEETDATESYHDVCRRVLAIAEAEEEALDEWEKAHALAPKQSEQQSASAGPGKKINWTNPPHVLMRLFELLVAKGMVEGEETLAATLASHFLVDGEETTNDTLRKSLDQHQNRTSVGNQERTTSDLKKLIDKATK